jgi:hypothetical protein
MGNPPPMILSYALFGLLSTAMLTYERQEEIFSELTDPNTAQWNNARPTRSSHAQTCQQNSSDTARIIGVSAGINLRGTIRAHVH